MEPSRGFADENQLYGSELSIRSLDGVPCAVSARQSDENDVGDVAQLARGRISDHVRHPPRFRAVSTVFFFNLFRLLAQL